MLDRYSYISPSRVKVLIVPINNCTQLNFARYLDIIRSTADEVRLLDITPLPELHYFNPQTFPTGKIMFDFITSAPESESIFLHDFEPFRKTFIVIGVGKYDNSIDKNKGIEIEDHLKNIYPSSIVHNVIYFDAPDDKIQELYPPSDHSFKTVFYHEGTTKNNITALETLMCDIARNFLNRLDNYASSYLNITLRSPVSITDSHSLTKNINIAQKRISSGSTSFKVSFSNGGSSNNSPSMDAKSKAQQRHNGRQSKLIGNLFLLAGKYSDALQHFSEAIVNLKKCEDHLWLGSALEGIGICVTLLQYIGVSYQLPNQAICTILQITKGKIQSIASNPNSEMTTPKRTSTDSLPSSVPSNGHINKPSPANNSSSLYSPRNSSSSIISFNFASSSSSHLDFASLSLPELVKSISSKVLQFYHLSANDYENMVPDIVYVESILRTIKFMIGVYLGGNELTRNVLEHIVKSTKIEPQNVVDNKYFSKAEILKEINKVFSLQLVDMRIIDQCRIYCSLATIYTDLGLLRKRAFMLRILLVCLLPKLESSLNSKENWDIQENISSLTGNNDHASSVRDIFESLFTVYGIDIQSESYVEAATLHSQSNWTVLQISLLRLCLKFSESIKDYPFLLKLCSLLLTRYTHCLPPDDQIKLKDKIEWLMYLSHRNNLNLSTPYWDPFLVRGVTFISNKNKDELIPFLEYEKNAYTVGLVDSSPSSVASNRSSATNPVNGPLIFNPYTKTKNTSIDKDKLLIKNDIYQLKVTLQNPFAFEIEITDLSIVTKGEVNVQTLKNLIRPLHATILQSQTFIQNKSSGLTKIRSNSSNNNQMRFQSTANGSNHNQTPSISSNISNLLVIAPNSTQQFQVSFKPLKSGQLNISGFDISVSNCRSQYFQIVDGERFNIMSKVKKVGLMNYNLENNKVLDKVITNLSENNISSRVFTQNLMLTVVPPQPSLSLSDISITNGWLMLLEGEKYSFSICLTNYSDELINFLSFSFWDSTMEPLNKKLNAGYQSLSASEIYEIEWYLLKLKPFRILNKDIISEKFKTIEPHSNMKIDYEITGKRGMKESKIMLEYSHKHIDDISKSFVKYVNVPLNISVMPSLEVVGCDIVPLFSSSFQGFEGNLNKILHKNLETVLSFITDIIKSKTESISDYCLLIIDLRNLWNEKLCSKLFYRISSDNSFEVEECIEPGKTSRFLLPIKRISSNDVDLTEPIPSLRNKQFIKNYSVTEEEEMTIRELFWLRKIILDNLEGSWETVDNTDLSKRVGNIELRAIRLTVKMASVLIFTKVRIFNSIIHDDEITHIERQGTHFLLKTEEFYTLRTTIVNSSKEPITGILRYLLYSTDIPSTTNPISLKSHISIDRKIIINGLLQNHIGREINPGESIVINLSFVILEKGDYEWGSVLDILKKENSHIVGREPIFISAS